MRYEIILNGVLLQKELSHFFQNCKLTSCYPQCIIIIEMYRILLYVGKCLRLHRNERSLLSVSFTPIHSYSEQKPPSFWLKLFNQNVLKMWGKNHCKVYSSSNLTTSKINLLSLWLFKPSFSSFLKKKKCFTSVLS